MGNKKEQDNLSDFFIDKEQKEPFIITLTDLETNEEKEFKVIADATIENKRYFAVIPAEEKTDDCFVLNVRADGDELILETIEDDDEYELVEDYFNDLLFGETDYDD